VVEREHELQEKEEEVAHMLVCGRSELSSREANLDTRETTLEVDRRSLGDLHVNILAHELTVDREKELADMEK
jgi:hypothetical protein